ncbi:uncharacterized protein RCC_12245 [Ramularia collo-cygni]|uniref:Uncharacterized protein n=1 Tax=Ramularia collo-cygni TaxID=112498 RepID=A0A2D3UPH6_9PEZI|nr:uncharacterized protein RCC_12245 [Ramularia collo-cygni]CZT14785.1 uncharacterized protein RCC_12245 [Ramularia collo-cygni]
MLLDSNAIVANFFSFYGFRGFLREDGNDLFLRLHVLDHGNALTCMSRKLDDCVSPYGGERCGLPISAPRSLCVAFQSLYFLAGDPRIDPVGLRVEVDTFARHCLCAEHAASEDAVHGVTERLFIAVQRWQCRRVFMDEPGGFSSTPPEERPGASRLSQFFIARAPNPTARRRPKFRGNAIDCEVEYDSWGVPHERKSLAENRPEQRRLLRPPQYIRPIVDGKTAEGHLDAVGGQPHLRRSHYQNFKGRAKNAMGKIVRDAT